MPPLTEDHADLVVTGMIDGVLESSSDGCGGHTGNHRLGYVEHDLLLEAVTRLDRHGFRCTCTRSAPRAGGRGEPGRVEVGARADLAVLDTDIFVESFPRNLAARRVVHEA